MNRKLLHTALALIAASLPLTAVALDFGGTNNPDRRVTVHGSVQADMLFPEEDAVIGTEKYSEKLLGNGYASAGLFSKYLDAGLRVEYLQHPLPGFDSDFKGWGVGNFYVNGKYKGFALTGGDFYEQFGSGLILRTYEDRPLGIDNAIRGGRLKISAINGLRLTALAGTQRRYWEWNTRSHVYGADLEWDLQNHIRALRRHDIVWTFGASWVMKHEKYDSENYIDTFNPDGEPVYLNLPKRVNAWDVRTHFYKGNVDVLLEAAFKDPDPARDNNYTFHHGSAILLSATYSRSGLSAQFQAKRSEDMAFRSRRTMDGISSFINNLPPFAYQHTYTLAALYPYATQAAPGEWAFQANFAYTFKRKTALGGRYGTKLRLNFSHIRGIKRDGAWKTDDRTLYGTDGIKTSFFGTGPLYYQDLNLQLDKKFSRVFTLSAMYMYQRYNKTVVEGKGGMINAHIAVGDAKFRLSDKVTLRTELQYLGTKQDHGDWLYGLAELSILPYIMVSASDQWNCGNTNGPKTHYYMFNLTGTYRNNRLMIGYGRTRAGFNCSGGVCRYVPATRGFQISYNYNF